MTNDELNNYILHYLTEDKTNSAIMLTGAWGTGKSYYIQHTLTPYLLENGDHPCIVVSLYGIKNTVEISKAIYMACRLGFLTKERHEGVAAALAASRTIIKGVTSFFGVDLSQSDEDMESLFESIDLSGKLIVLEDLERSGIDVLEVLGYVNNLVEQDGVKVLLVSNESEIIKYESKNRIIGQQKKEEIEAEKSLRAAFDLLVENSETIIRSQSSEEYIRIKEKTISDTIQYKEDYQTAILEIIASFENDTLNRFSSKETAKDITDIMRICKSWNLRSFIFACQKTVDIFKALDSRFLSDDDFIQAIFFGILFFALRIKNGQELAWGKELLFSVELGNEHFPLFKFCYEYLTRQIIDTSSVQASFDALKELILFDKNKSNSDPDINTICSYHIHTEEEILTALHNIEEKLSTKPDEISFYMYGTIAVYAIVIKEILSCNIDGIKSSLVSNLRGKGNKLSLDYIFRTVMGDSVNEASKEEYASLRKDMAEALQGEQILFSGFEYLPEQASAFNDAVNKNEMRFHSQGGFARDLNMEKLARMFRDSTPMQKEEIRAAFVGIYRIGNIGSFLSADKDNIILLLDLINEQEKENVGDKIDKIQYDWFVSNLKEIVKKLS